jgi:LPS export ABC transporter protein LptC
MKRGSGGLRRVFLAAVIAAPQGQPNIEITGFHLVESQGRRRSIEIQARKAFVFKKQNLMTLDAVRSLAWGRETQKPFEITGDSALVNSETQDLELLERARVVSPDGFVFRTKGLFYNAANRLITAEGEVDASQVANRQDSALSLTGRGLLIDLAKNSYEIKNRVRTEQLAKKTSNANALTITSRQLLIQPDDKLATFTRDVSVHSANFTLKGDKLLVHLEKASENSPFTAKKLVLGSREHDSRRRIEANLGSMTVQSKGLTVDLDPASGEIAMCEAVGQAEAATKDGVHMKSDTLISDKEGGRDRILLKGHVTIQTDDRTGTCQEAVFYPESGDIVLERIASVVAGTQVLEGDRIRLSTKHADIKVERAKGVMNRDDLNRH